LPSNKKRSIRVLHVDDDLCLLEASRLILSDEHNFKVDDATSVNDAFRKMAQQKYDAIVSDYGMFPKNGLEFLKELREKQNDVPFVLFTGKEGRSCCSSIEFRC
jgi:DNA-binding response OmpR family regulator